MPKQMKTWKPITPPPDITGSGFWVGVAGYSYDDWVDRFNPPEKKTAESEKDLERFRFYQRYFSFVEINRTFNEEPSFDFFDELEKNSKVEMRFAVRVHRDISHTDNWDPVPKIDLMHRLMSAVVPIVETGKFYSFLIQLEDRVHRSQQALDYFLTIASEALKRNFDVHIEFRHASWHNSYPLQVLKNNGIGVCNVEIPPMSHVFPLKSYATTEKAYVRYNGLSFQAWRSNRKKARDERADYLYTEAQIEDRIQGQIGLVHKASQVAVVYTNTHQSKAILNALQNIRQLKQYFEFAQVLST